MDNINGVPIQNCFHGEAHNLKFEGEVSIHMIEAMIEVGKTVGLRFSLFKTLPPRTLSLLERKASQGYLYVFREKLDGEDAVYELPDSFWNHSYRVYWRLAKEAGGALKLISGPEPIYYG